MKSIRGEDFDIIEDREFASSNHIFAAQCVVLKKLGLAKIDHHPPLHEDDVKQLYDSQVLSLNNPVSLQRKVFFDMMLHFCRRAMENLREITIYDFEVKTNGNGKEYVVNVTDELTKNHRESDANEDPGMMLATGEENCPVRSYKYYIEKLNPKQSAFFQRPKNNTPSSGVWYDNMVLGVKSLEAMMKNISKAAILVQYILIIASEQRR